MKAQIIPNEAARVLYFKSLIIFCDFINVETHKNQLHKRAVNVRLRDSKKWHFICFLQIVLSEEVLLDPLELIMFAQ